MRVNFFLKKQVENGQVNRGRKEEMREGTAAGGGAKIFQS